MLTDPLHGKVSAAFGPLGYPVPAFPLAVGAWSAAIAALNFADGGKHILTAQRMLSILMGGTFYHHIVAEGAPTHIVGGVVFLGLSIAVPVLRGDAKLPEAVGTALALAAVGWGIGVLVHTKQVKQKK